MISCITMCISMDLREIFCSYDPWNHTFLWILIALVLLKEYNRVPKMRAHVTILYFHLVTNISMQLLGTLQTRTRRSLKTPKPKRRVRTTFYRLSCLLQSRTCFTIPWTFTFPVLDHYIISNYFSMDCHAIQKQLSRRFLHVFLNLESLQILNVPKS